MLGNGFVEAMRLPQSLYPATKPQVVRYALTTVGVPNVTTISIRQQIDELFADASQIRSQAVEGLEQGDIRNAAEKAWCATKRATDAPLLARTGEQPDQRRPRQPGPSRSIR